MKKQCDINQKDPINRILGFCLASLLFLALSSTIIMSSLHTSATGTTSVESDVAVIVPASCTMGGVGSNNHNATLSPGTWSGASGSEYENGIGKTVLTTYCNDYNGFSIYAIGYTGNEYGNTNLVGTAHNNLTIPTGVYSTGDTTSKWSMKVTKETDSTISYNPVNMNITNSFDNWHIVPSTYTQVAQYKANTGSSMTDTLMGAKVNTTYAAYISSTQAADTYNGQVKYTMVHPYNADTPVPPDTMQDFAAGIATTTCASMNQGDIITLEDSRDGTAYRIGKLADNNCWMLDNLALDIVANKDRIDAINTDINGTDAEKAAILNSLKNQEGNRSAGDQYSTAGVSYWINPYSYSVPLIAIKNANDDNWDPTTIPQGDDPMAEQALAGDWKIGIYYNYCAASAGSYCYGNGISAASTSSGDATSSVCPKGWRMPTGRASGEYRALFNSGYNTYAKYRETLYLPLSGSFNNGSSGDQGTIGFFWSSTREGNATMYRADIDTNNVNFSYSTHRVYGFSVRCIFSGQ